jgi:hypothetical protein
MVDLAVAEKANKMAGQIPEVALAHTVMGVLV